LTIVSNTSTLFLRDAQMSDEPKLVLLFLSLSLVLGCGGSENETKPLSVPKFDERDAKTTMRWLIEKAKPFVASGERSRNEQSNNPLRKEDYKAHVAYTKEWNSFLASLRGKQVIWPVRAHLIFTQEVEVDCIPAHLDQDNIDVIVFFAQYPDPNDRFTHNGRIISGRLIIGKNITMEEAKKLNQGTVFAVKGVVDDTRYSLDGGYQHITLYISDTKAVLP
jgi:hypothetical protein